MNTHPSFRIFIILAYVWGAFLQISPIRAQGESFSETFDNPDLPGWERSPNVEVLDGVLQLGPDGSAIHGGPWNDFHASVRFRHPGDGEAMILYRVTDAGSYVVRIGLDHIALNRRAEGTDVELAAAPNPSAVEEWNDVTIDVSGNRHEVRVKGNATLSTSDPTPLPPGGFGFQYDGGGTAAFDDLTITPIEGEPVETQAPPPSGEPVKTQAPPPSEEEPAGERPEAGELRWVYTGGPPGGLGYDIRYKPSDPNTWYVTDAFAGAFISTDDGHTWQPTNKGISGQAGPSGDWIPVFSLTIDPHDNNIIWVGTQNTGHIYKSTDGGATWTQKDRGISIKYHALSFRGFTVDPRSSDIVYAMAETTRNEPNPDETGGQIYKSLDGGENWQLIWDGGMPSALARYLWINPNNPEILYASTGIFDRGAVNGSPASQLNAGFGVLKSTDGGTTWRALGQANGLELMHIGSLFMHPDNPDVLLAAAGHLGGNEDLMFLEGQGYSPAGIYRTVDGGETWEHVLAAPISRPMEAYTSVEICPSDPNIAYAGSEYAIYRSEDSGESWDLVAGGDQRWGPPGVVAGFPIDMQCDEKNPDRIFANNYAGGNFLSEDGGMTWVNASQGYTGAHILSLSMVSGKPGELYASGRSGIWKTDTGGNSWVGLRPDHTDVFPLDTGAIAVDPSNQNRLLSGGRNVFTLIESLDGGQTWKNLWQLSDLGIEHPMKPDMVPSAIVFAPSNPQIVYIGGAHENGARRHEPYFQGIGVLISKDGGKTASQASDASLSQLAVFDIAVHPTDANTAYAATSEGIFKTADGGDSWESLPMAGDLKWVWTVAIHPQNPDTLIAGVEQAGPQISTNGGQTWQPGNAGWETNGSPSAIVFDPNNPQTVYMADYISGAYRSEDGGFTWGKINQGLILRNVVDMVITHDGNHLYAGTFGGGVFRLDLNGQLPVAGLGAGIEPEEEEPESAAGPAMPAEESQPMPPILVGVIALFVVLVVVIVIVVLRRRQ